MIRWFILAVLITRLLYRAPLMISAQLTQEIHSAGMPDLISQYLIAYRSVHPLSTVTLKRRFKGDLLRSARPPMTRALSLAPPSQRQAGEHCWRRQELALRTSLRTFRLPLVCPSRIAVLGTASHFCRQLIRPDYSSLSALVNTLLRSKALALNRRLFFRPRWRSKKSMRKVI